MIEEGAVTNSDKKETISDLQNPSPFLLVLNQYHRDSLERAHQSFENEDVIVGNYLSKGLRSYLHPVDTDPEMVGWYLRALIKWPTEGFVRFISVHHVASNIWPDLRISPRAEGDIDTILSLPPSAHDRRARVLLSAILNQASNETIKDILCYRQNISGSDGVLLPPACFLTMTDVNKIEARIEFVRGLGNDVLTKSFSEKVSKVYGCL